jgi:dipeptidyl aminopeptidase/acylaminoacyl peptidase
MRISGVALLALVVAGQAVAQAPPQPEALAPPATDAKAPTVPTPAAIVADGIPPVPIALRDATLPYMESRAAGFLSWHPTKRSMLIATRFGNSNQLHEVLTPGAARTQLTFEPEPVSNGGVLASGDVTIAIKDVGGGENFQIYRVEGGRLVLLTDGKSRHTGTVQSKDGRLIGYASNARNGRDSDLYVMDPRDPKTARKLADREGGGWSFADFHPDGRSALVGHYRSVEDSELFTMNLASGALTALTVDQEKIAWGDARYGPDGRLFVTSDKGSDFQQLGELVPGKGFAPIGPAAKWDVESFDVSPDGKALAVVSNEAGVARLRILDSRTGAVLAEPRLPAGVIGGLEYAPWGALGFSLASAKSPADAYSFDPATDQVQRWTTSETGGLDASRNVEPDLIRVKSFDGLEVTGLGH